MHLRTTALPTILLCTLMPLLGACSMEAISDAAMMPSEPPPSGRPPAPASRPPERETGREDLCEDCTFVDLAAGNGHTCGVLDDGSVRCWGGNRWGQLGDGSPRHGDCSILGNVDYTDCSSRAVAVRELGDVVDLSVGNASACALSASGEVSCWGRTHSVAGAMSQAVERHRPAVQTGFHGAIAVSDGSAHSCAVDGAGTVWCRGLNWAGQLGTGDFRDRGEAVAVVDLPPAHSVAASATAGFTCATTRDGVYCWGDDTSGQLGDGERHETCFDGVSSYECSPRPVHVAALDGFEIAELSLGRSHACALTHAGEVFCWGAGARGQLGDGAFEPSALPTPLDVGAEVVSVATGQSFTCLLTADGRVACVGDNAFGQLGDGARDHGSVCDRFGSVADCTADVVWALDIDDATHITAGSAHACALRADGNVACWGLNHEKQLGDGTRDERAAPVHASRITPRAD